MFWFILEHALVLFAYFCTVTHIFPAGVWLSLFWDGDSPVSFLFSRCTKNQKEDQAGEGVAVIMMVRELGGLGATCPNI